MALKFGRFSAIFSVLAALWFNLYLLFPLIFKITLTSCRHGASLPGEHLDADSIATLNLYTQESCFYKLLNSALRYFSMITKQSEEPAVQLEASVLLLFCVPLDLLLLSLSSTTPFVGNVIARSYDLGDRISNASWFAPPASHDRVVCCFLCSSKCIVEFFFALARRILSFSRRWPCTNFLDAQAHSTEESRRILSAFTY